MAKATLALERHKPWPWLLGDRQGGSCCATASGAIGQRSGPHGLTVVGRPWPGLLGPAENRVRAWKERPQT